MNYSVVKDLIILRMVPKTEWFEKLPFFLIHFRDTIKILIKEKTKIIVTR